MPLLLEENMSAHIRSLITNATSIICISASNDQGESAAATIGIHAFLHRIKKDFLSHTLGQEQIKHLNFLPFFERFETLAAEKFVSNIAPHTVIITIGITDHQDLPESLQTIRLTNPDVSIINIDRQSHNTNYGTINLVDSHASALSEPVYQVLSAINIDHIDTPVATALLASMIIATKSFRSGRVRPESLALASHLVARGAERETIIHRLYRSRSLATLRLWGHALTRLKNNPSGLITTIVTREDIAATGADRNEIHGVADELLTNAPEARATLVLYEDPAPEKNTIHGLLSSEYHFSCLQLTEHLKGSGHERRALFSVVFETLEKAEEELAKDFSERIQFLDAQAK